LAPENSVPGSYRIRLDLSGDPMAVTIAALASSDGQSSVSLTSIDLLRTFCGAADTLMYLGSTSDGSDGRLVATLRSKMAEVEELLTPYLLQDGSLALVVGGSSSSYSTSCLVSCVGRSRGVYNALYSNRYQSAANWLSLQLQSDGSVVPVGFHPFESTYGVENPLYSSSAMVLVALMDFNASSTSASTLNFLVDSRASYASDSFSVAVALWAMIKTKNAPEPVILELISILNSLSALEGNAIRFWEAGNSTIGASSFALLSFVARMDSEKADQVANHLFRERRLNGMFSPFSSDTMFGTQALSQYSRRPSGGKLDLTVVTSGPSRSYTFDETNRRVINSLLIDPLEDPSFAAVLIGSGTALFQESRSWTVLETLFSTAVQFNVTWTSGPDTVAVVDVCVEDFDSVSSAPFRIQIGLFSGFIPTVSSLNRLVQSGHVASYSILQDQLELSILRSRCFSVDVSQGQVVTELLEATATVSNLETGETLGQTVVPGSCGTSEGSVNAGTLSTLLATNAGKDYSCNGLNEMSDVDMGTGSSPPWWAWLILGLGLALGIGLGVLIVCLWTREKKLKRARFDKKQSELSLKASFGESATSV
jgi:hypothetical protein